jgi:hypothetical protein
MRKIIRTILAHYGHVFTLSDSNFKIKWYVKIPILLGQLSFFCFRQHSIKNEKDIERLKNTLKNIGWLNVNWLLSISKIFAIKTIDEQWQKAAKVLLDGSKLVIIDISSLTTSLAWEVQVTKECGLEQNIILIASKDNAETALEWKNRYDEPDKYDIPLFYYNDKGLIAKQNEFEEGIVSILAKDYLANHTSYTVSVIKRTLSTTGIILAVFFVVLFFISPYLFPNFVARNSPFPAQATKAYIQSKLTSLKDPEQVQIRDRLKKKWPEKVAAHTLTYAIHHESTECEAIAEALRDLADASQMNNYIKLVEDGDEVISQSASDIVLRDETLHPEQLVLHFLSNNKLHIKEKMLSFIQEKETDANFLSELTNILGNDDLNKIETKYLETQHDDAKSKERLEHRIKQYYLDLYGFLNRNRALVNISIMRSKYTASQNKDIKIIFALNMLIDNDASGIESMFDNYFLTKYYNAEIKKPGTLYIFEGIFGGPPKPFREITNSILGRKIIFNQLPRQDLILETKASLHGSTLPTPLIRFLLRNYPGISLMEFNEVIAPASLSASLHEYFVTESPEKVQRFTDILIAKRDGLNLIIEKESIHIDERLNTAWLLANIGDIAAAKIAIESSRKTKTFILSTYYPYESKSEDILKALIKKTSGNFHKSYLIALKHDLRPNIEALLNKLINKARY